MKTLVRFPLLFLILLLGSSVLKGEASPDERNQEAIPQKVRVLVVTGGHSYDVPAFDALLASFPELEITQIKLPQDRALLAPGLEKQYDVLLLYDQDNTPLTDEQKKNFLDLLDAGIGVFALHHHQSAHQDWDEHFDIVGGRGFWKNDVTLFRGKEYPRSTYVHDLDLEMTPTDPNHPITKGIVPFIIKDEAYGNCLVRSDVHLLLTTNHPSSSPNIAWTCQYGKSPIFVNLLGHDAAAWNNPEFRKIFIQAIHWLKAKPSLSIDCQFPGGNIIVDSIEEDVIKIHRDLRDTEGDWFYWAFRVRGAQGQKRVFQFTQTNCIGARGPAVSSDGGVTWKWLGETGFSTNKFEYEFAPSDTEVIFAFGMIYTQATLERFLEANKDKFTLEKSVLCQSPHGRDVEMIRFGNPNNEHKLAILLTNRHHACEMMAAYAVEGILEEVFSGTETGNWLLNNVDFLWIPFMDKDGVEEGDQGKNRKPHDHNRDYHVKSYSEVQALTKLVRQWGEGKRVMFTDYHCPWIRSGMHETLYFPAPESPYMAEQVKRFSLLLEQNQAGAAIPFKESFNLPFGTGWNVGTGGDQARSMSEWAARQPNAIFGATLEVPYANASGQPVTVETARELGHRLAQTYRAFLQEEIDQPTINKPPVFPNQFAVHFNKEGKYLSISGVYPHLCVFNQPPDNKGDPKHGESGIGALVPWADKLWYLTYSQHATRGSNDKLYSVDDQLHLTIEKQSLGGTHANRMIHRESNQLFMGYYAIDAQGKIRTFNPNVLVGRMTATMRHLLDPENKIYYFDMEGAIYEANVHTLEVNRLYKKPFPGWHGKGAYTGQDRVVFANNGGTINHPVITTLLVGGPESEPEAAGILAQWDGKETFEIIKERQFTDVTGPGDIQGASSMEEPIWSMGWDKRSVLLELMEGRKWYTFRVPKSSYTFDPKHGWFTEWPRIRETLPGLQLMCMHAGLFEFPKTFSLADTSGIQPLTTHLRYIPDMCGWKDKIILSTDETSIQENPISGQAQSNLWFGTLDEIRRFGPKTAWGGIWMDDAVKAGEPSVPFLFFGYTYRTLHLKGKPGDLFEIQFDQEGKGIWTADQRVTIGPSGYTAVQFNESLAPWWIRIVPQQDGTASAFFQYLSPRDDCPEEQKIFASLAEVSGQELDNSGSSDQIDSAKTTVGGIIRPAMHNRALQWLMKTAYTTPGQYIEVDLNNDATGFDFLLHEESRDLEMRTLCGRGNPIFSVDAASVVVTDVNQKKWRLPKGAKGFDSLNLRGIREIESERYIAQLHGTFYEVPRMGIRAVPDYHRMKPVASHNKRIDDYCTWRGLLVLCGTKQNATADGHYFANHEGTGLWFGQIDDLWKLGRPKGEGGPLYETEVEAGVPSDPYLMLGYDDKSMTFTMNSQETVTMTIEVDFDLTGFSPYTTVTIPAGQKVEYCFPKGFQAHWLRIVADKPCKATAWCVWQ